VDRDEPLIRLSVIPDSSSANCFAVILSVSHVIIDGFNYYQLLSMLNKDNTIVALSCARKHSFINDAKIAMGEDEHNFMHSKSVMMNVLYNRMFRKAITFCHEIDAEKVSIIKQQYNSDSTSGFVSTNDILSSTFAKAVNCRILCLTINYRIRLATYDNNDAGNYQGLIVMGPED